MKAVGLASDPGQLELKVLLLRVVVNEVNAKDAGACMSEIENRMGFIRTSWLLRIQLPLLTIRQA